MKKLFTLLAVAAIAFTGSAETTEYIVRSSSNGTLTVGQVLSTNDQPVEVTSIYAAGKSKDMKNGPFADGTPSAFFTAVSAKFRVNKAPTIDTPDGVEQTGSGPNTALKLVVSQKLDSLKIYFEASGGNRSFHLFNRTDGTDIVSTPTQSTEKVTSGTQYGFIAEYADVEPGEYTVYNTGFGAGFVGLRYKITSNEATDCGLAFENKTYSAVYGEEFVSPKATVKEDAKGSISYSSSNPAVASVDPSTGELTFGDEGVAVITATYTPTAGEAYEEKTANYTVSYSTYKTLVAFNVPGVDNQGVYNHGTASTTKTITINGVSLPNYYFGNSWNGTENIESNGYLKLTCDGNFRVGDKLIVKGAISNGSKTAGIHIYQGGYDNKVYTSENFVDLKNEPNAPATEVEWIVTENTDAIYLSRNGGTGCYIVYIEVKRDMRAEDMTTLSTPEISFDNNTLEVTIQQAENAEVRYTTDGSVPTAESALYTDPFTVEDGTTVKAIAIGDNKTTLNSEVASAFVLREGVAIETPVINSFNGTFYISCATPLTTIEYSYDGETWNTFTKAITLMEKDETVYARASREGSETTEVVSAEVKVLLPAVTPDKTICIGYGSFDNGKDTYYLQGTAGKEDRAYGFNIRMSREDAAYQGASKIYVNSVKATRTGIKAANHATNYLEIPEYLMVTRMVLYSYVNYANSIVAWSEVNGEEIENYTSIPMGCMPGIDASKEGNPDVRVFNFDNAEGEISFTATGTQVVYTLDVDVIQKQLENAAHANEGHQYVEGEEIAFAHDVEGVEVLYTIDGVTDPDPDNVYVAPIEDPEVEPAAVRRRVSEEHSGRTYSHTTTPLTYTGEPMTVKYRVVKDGYKPSDVWTLNVGEGGVTTGIANVMVEGMDVNAPVYNVYGQRVDASYRGIVIKNGKKYIQK